MSDCKPVPHGPVEASVEGAARANALRAQLTAELCGLGATMTAAMDAAPGFVPCGHAFGVVIEGLRATVASDDEAELAELAQAVHDRSEHVSAHRGVPQGQACAPDVSTPEAALLLAALRGIVADAYAGMQRGKMDDDVNILLVNALAALGADTVDHALLTRAAATALAAAGLAR